MKQSLLSELEEINKRNREYIFNLIQEENLKQSIAAAEKMAEEYFARKEGK